MRAWVLAGLLLGAASAGCLASDQGPGDRVIDQGRGPFEAPPLRGGPGVPLTCPSDADACARQHLNLTIAPATDQRWTLRGPLPVAPNGTSERAWMVNVSANAAVAIDRGDDGEGAMIEITGAGHVVVQSRALLVTPAGASCCARAFVDAMWTRAGDAGAPMVHVDGALGRVDLLYEARGAGCERVDHYELEGPDAGWQVLDEATDDRHAHGTACG